MDAAHKSLYIPYTLKLYSSPIFAFHQPITCKQNCLPDCVIEKLCWHPSPTAVSWCFVLSAPAGCLASDGPIALVHTTDTAANNLLSTYSGFHLVTVFLYEPLTTPDVAYPWTGTLVANQAPLVTSSSMLWRNRSLHQCRMILVAFVEMYTSTCAGVKQITWICS